MIKKCIPLIAAGLVILSTCVTAIADNKYDFSTITQYGSVDSQFDAASEKTIFFIKDAHCTPDAQKNSIEIMTHLLEENDIHLICMEGAAGPLDIDGLAAFPLEAVKKDVCFHFLNDGSINGAEYLSIMHPSLVTVEGIETGSLYRKNYYSFYKSLSLREKAGKNISTLLTFLMDLRAQYFSTPLLNIDNAMQALLRNELSLCAFAELLAQYDSVSNAPYPTLALFLDVAKSQNKFDTEHLEYQKEHLFQTLLSCCKKEDKKDILMHKFKKISAKQYRDFIVVYTDKYLIDRDQYTDLTASLENMILLDTIDHLMLLSEMESYIATIKQTLYTGTKDARLDQALTAMRHLQQACDLRLPSSSQQMINEYIQSLDISELYSFCRDNSSETGVMFNLSKDDLALIKSTMSYVREFYGYAEERNKHLITNTLRRMTEHDATTCIIYAGGFHAPSIIESLKDNSINGIVLSPYITNLKETLYDQQMRVQKNAFVAYLETMIPRLPSQMTGMLAVASKLVFPLDALIDRVGAQAFSIQMKTFYLAAGIQTGFQQLDETLLSNISLVSEDQIAALSDNLRRVIEWKNEHVPMLTDISITREDDTTLTLKFKLFGESFYLPNILARTTSTQSDTALTSIQMPHGILSIYKSSSHTLSTVTFPDEIDEQTAFMLLNQISTLGTASIETLSKTTDATHPELERSIVVLERYGLLVNTDTGYALPAARRAAITAALRLYATHEGTGPYLQNLDTISFPPSFAQFMTNQNITQVELPGDITFTGILYMLESLPASKNIEGRFPVNETAFLTFSIEKQLGSSQNSLIVSIDDNKTEQIQRERAALLGRQYQSIIAQQLFGPLPAAASAMLIDPSIPNSIVSLHGTDTESSLIWATPEQLSAFWYEINRIAEYDEADFAVSGGLLFGTQIGSDYVVTDIVPLQASLLTNQDDETCDIDPGTLTEMLTLYTNKQTKLIGVYRNTQPSQDREGYVRSARQAISRDQSLLHGFRSSVVSNPLAIFFTGISPARQQAEPAFVSNTDMTMQIHALDTVNPVLLSSTSLSDIMPTEPSMFRGITRALSLRRTSKKEPEEDIAIFRRLPHNKGFVLTTHRTLSDAQMDAYLHFFQSYKRHIEQHTTLKEIRIKTGLRHAAHTNRQDEVIEFDADILQYPTLIQYLAFPHEWNHAHLNLAPDLEEILILMYDLERLAELYIKDRTAANRFLNELEQYEAVYGGKKLFYSTLQSIFEAIESTDRLPTRSELLDYAEGFILADPDLKIIAASLLATQSKAFFIRQFELQKDRLSTELPAYLPGERDFAVFDEQQINRAHSLRESKVIDLMRLHIRYLPQNNFEFARCQLSRDIQFEDPLGYFDPNRKEIVINITHDYHLAADGTMNPDTIFSTLIKQRTHYLLHDNPEIIKNIVDTMHSDRHIRDQILSYFILYRTGILPREITDQHLQMIGDNPTYSTGGSIDFHRIVRETMAASNGYNALIHMVNKFQDLKQKFSAEDQELPAEIETRIKKLVNFTLRHERILLFKHAALAEKFFIELDPNITPVFQAPNFSTLHIVHLEYDEILESILSDLDIPLELPKEQPMERPIRVAAKDQIKPLLAEPISATQLSNFTTLFDTTHTYDPAAPVADQYTPQLAQQNARDFYQFLLKKHTVSATRDLPTDIIVADIFLGSVAYIKDFLDEFRQQDTDGIFYSRLKYHVMSHSHATRYMIERLQESQLLAPYAPSIVFDEFTELDQAEDIIQRALLVRSYGNTSLLTDMTIIEKNGDSYFEIYGTPIVIQRDYPQYVFEALTQSLNYPNAKLAPELQSLPASLREDIKWHEEPTAVKVEDVPFGLFVQAYTENAASGRFVYHPALLRLAQSSLSTMSLKFGGYWQLFGDSFEAIGPYLYKADKTTSELDSIFLAHMIETKGDFLFENQQHYLDMAKQRQIAPIIRTISSLEIAEISKLIPPVKITDLIDAAKISALRGTPPYASHTDEFTFRRFVRELKRTSLLPPDITVKLVSSTDDKDTFIVSIENALKLYFSQQAIAGLIADYTRSPSITSEEELIEALHTDPLIDSRYITKEYLKKIFKTVIACTTHTDFHLRISTQEPSQTVLALPALDVRDKTEETEVKVIKLNNHEFQQYLQNLTQDNPYLDYGDARGIANPIDGEIVINMEHAAHIDSHGRINIAALRQTIIHEKTHMLIFARWDTLQEIVEEAIKYPEHTDLIIKLFFDVYYGEQITTVKEEHKNRLRRDPLWNYNGIIAYDRIMSELLSTINQYHMLPNMLRQFHSLQMEFSQEGKAVPEYIISAQEFISDIFQNNGQLISRSVAARTQLARMDPRINKSLIFKPQEYDMPIRIENIQLQSMPLPSAPLKTVFDNTAVMETISTTWKILGNGDIERGQTLTRVGALQSSDIAAALSRLRSLSEENPAQSDQLSMVAERWQTALDHNAIHIIPSSPDMFSIIGTHYFFIDPSGTIFIARGFWEYLKEHGQLAHAMAVHGSRTADLPVGKMEDLFDAPSIEDLERRLYEKHLENVNYLPVVSAALSLYGITLNDIPHKMLAEIIEKHRAVLTLPGAETHLQNIQHILRDTTSLRFEQSPVHAAVEVYAQADMSSSEITALQQAIIDINHIVARELSAPVILVIDYDTFKGETETKNFAVRETLERIRREIESLEQKNVLIIAIDLQNRPVSEVRHDLDANLLRKGASSEDFDYVTSYRSADELMTALAQEYPAIPPQILNSSIKVLAEPGHPLIAFAQKHGMSYREIIDRPAEGAGVFLIDYLRSISLTHFIADAEEDAEIALSMRESMLIVDIAETIDTTGLQETSLTILDQFNLFIEHISFETPVSTVLDRFYDTLTDIQPDEWSYLVPYLEEQYNLHQLRALFQHAQQQDMHFNILINLYNKLEQTFDSSSVETRSYAKIIADFHASLEITEREVVASYQDIAMLLQQKELTDVPVERDQLFQAFSTIILKPEMFSATELLRLEQYVRSGKVIRPILLEQLSAAAQQQEISVTEVLNRYARITLAPRIIEPGLQKLMQSQRLFDESA